MTSIGRISKRAHQACENCRRKKSRCPGERPACSTCTRLNQACRYLSSGILHERIRNDPASLTLEKALNGAANVESRLAQLEDNMRLVLGRVGSDPQPRDAESFQSHSGDTPGLNLGITETDTSLPGIPIEESFSGSIPPNDVIEDGINVYIHQCHRQPLWLFSQDHFTTFRQNSKELLFSLLAISTRHSKHPYFDGKVEWASRKYCDAARSLAMARVADGRVNLSTLQSLVLLSFANFVSNDIHLAWLHLGLAEDLTKSAGLDTENNRFDRKVGLEAGRMLFWTIHHLQQTIGRRQKTFTLSGQVQDPQYIGISRDSGKHVRETPPMFPQEAPHDNQPKGNGIWPHMVQQATLWREVRDYVSSFCGDATKMLPPWSPDSGYTAICGHLMELETRFPQYHRYDAVRFEEKSTEELHLHRDYYAPWLFIQLTYHAIHAMLNHPFLFSLRPRQSEDWTAPNTFWKKSSSLASIHTTWIVRLIEMANEKDFQVSDPFLGHVAAIAATVHLYYFRAVDRRVGQAAQAKFNRCLQFIRDLGEAWPVCRVMGNLLETLVQSAFDSPRSQTNIHHDESKRTVLINTVLMWELLDFASIKHHHPSGNSGRGIFDLSMCQESTDDERINNNQTVETQIFHESNEEPDMSNGGEQLPPFLASAHNYSSRRLASSSMRVVESNSQSSMTEDDYRGGELVPTDTMVESSSSSSWPVFIGNGSVMDISYDPFFQFHDEASLVSDFWDAGNL